MLSLSLVFIPGFICVLLGAVGSQLDFHVLWVVDKRCTGLRVVLFYSCRFVCFVVFGGRRYECQSVEVSNICSVLRTWHWWILGRACVDGVF